MKRYDCTMHDKRGAFGLCMEARSEGQFVPFTKVEQLQAKIFGLLEERNSTGIAINNAIRSGILPDKHPLRSRLELLANHHEHEMELAAQLSNATRQCGVMAGLLREANDSVYFHLESPDSRLSGEEAGKLIALTERIADALAGKLPDPAVTVTETIRTAPERIWLQVGDQEHYHCEPFPRDTSEVSWCADSVVGCEVPYVRADLAATTPEQAKSEKRTVTISGKGLLELVDFTCPDHETDLEQQETEIVLLNREAFISTDGEKMPSGVYAYLAEYPEEGLYGPVGGPDQQGGEPCATEPPSSSQA